MQRVQHFSAKKNQHTMKYVVVTQPPQPPQPVPIIQQPIEKPQKEVTERPKECIICCEPMDHLAFFSNCDHDPTLCWRCAARIWVLSPHDHEHHDNAHTCPMCKAEITKVFFSTNDFLGPNDKRTQIIEPFLQDNFKEKFYYDPKWRVYIWKEDLEIILPQIEEIRALKCQVCGDNYFSHLDQLKKHLYYKHNLQYCSECLTNRKVFLQEQKVYSPQGLFLHETVGEPDVKFGQIGKHPLCEFCTKRFYSDNEFFKHMHQSHVQCEICRKTNFDQAQFEFYDTLENLKQHYADQHHPCTHPECSGLVVFMSELELMSHELNIHGSELTKKKGKKVSINQIFSMDPSIKSSTSRHPTADQEMAQRRLNEISSSRVVFLGLNNKPKSSWRSHRKSGGNKDNNLGTDQFQEISGVSPNPEEQEKKSLALFNGLQEILTKPKFLEFRKTSRQFLKGEILATEFYKTFLSIFDIKVDRTEKGKTPKSPENEKPPKTPENEKNEAAPVSSPSKTEEIPKQKEPSIFGDENIETIFMDLVGTIPNRQKADALYLAHTMFSSKEFGDSNVEFFTSNKEEKDTQPKEVPKTKKQQELQDFPKLQKLPDDEDSGKDKKVSPFWSEESDSAWDIPKIPKKLKLKDFPSLGENSSSSSSSSSENHNNNKSSLSSGQGGIQFVKVGKKTKMSLDDAFFDDPSGSYLSTGSKFSNNIGIGNEEDKKNAKNSKYETNDSIWSGEGASVVSKSKKAPPKPEKQQKVPTFDPKEAQANIEKKEKKKAWKEIIEKSTQGEPSHQVAAADPTWMTIPLKVKQDKRGKKNKNKQGGNDD